MTIDRLLPPLSQTGTKPVRVNEGVHAQRGEITIDLALRYAGTHSITLSYELSGPAKAPVIWIAGGISANQHVAANESFQEKGWLNDLVAPGRTLDPSQWRILAFNFVGADGSLDVPIDTLDQATAIVAVLDALGIEQVYTYIGYSYGALVGLQLAANYPQRVQRLVAVSGAHRAHPYAAAWRALQRRVVALAQQHNVESEGLALAREFAMLSYRTQEEFGERFDTPPQLINNRARVGAEDYLDAAGARYVASTHTNAYLRLSESIDLHQVDPSLITVSTIAVAVEGDRLVPLSDMVTLVEKLGKKASLRILRSAYGHDAFLKETDRVDTILANTLRTLGEPI